MNPIPALAAVVREVAPETLILVDSVSALGAVPFEMDAWGIDVVITGSQKAWMAAPGLAMVAASERAWAAMETATMPRFYLDLRAHRDAQAKGQTPWTPAIAVVYQVDEGLSLMEREGAPAIFARHEACAAAARAGLVALGFELFADPAVRLADRDRGPASPRTSTGRRSTARSRPAGVVLAGGQGKLTGHVFRLGHLGSVTLGEIIDAISVLEEVSIAHGRPVEAGRAVAAAQRAALQSLGAARSGGRMRILVAEPVAREGVELLRAHHEVDERPGLTRAEYAAILPDYDALVVRSQVQVDAELIAAGSRLVVIGRAGVGVDNVDLDAATRAGIVVVNAPTGNTIAAAEHTLALLYALARRVAAADASVRRGEWKRSQFTGVELRGKTLGIVGLGKIGQAIAKRARAMEMTVLAVDPFVSAEQAALHGVELVEFDELLPRADAITLHVPLSRSTRGLIGGDELARMKPGAFVLNVARGGVIDEAALAAALHEGRIGGAGIDVFEQEPPVGSPLLDAPEHRPHPAPRGLHRGGPGPGGRGGRRPDPRRPRRTAGALRRERAAPHPRDGPGDRAVPAPGRDPGQLLRPVQPGRGQDPDPRGRRRARGPRRQPAHGGGPARSARDGDHRTGQPRERRRAGQGARDHRGRAEDTRRPDSSPRCSPCPARPTGR